METKTKPSIIMSKKSQFHVVALSFAFLLIISSSTISLAQVTKQVDLQEFHTISLNSNYKVIVRQSNKQEVTAKADPEIWKSTNLWVDNGVLHVDVKDDNTGKKNLLQKMESKLTETMELRITVKELNKIIINSSGSVEAENSINSSYLTIEMNGQGKVTLDARSTTVEVNMFAAGTITLSGYSDEMTLNASGDATFNGQNFDVKTITAIARGTSTNCKLSVSEILDIKVFGNAEVFYSGDAKDVNKTVYGNGFVLFK